MIPSSLTRAAWVEIDLDCLAHNMREIRRLVPEPTLVTAVIKANGYGHGAVAIGQTFLENGADRFAVATLGEALELRQAFSNTDILILGYVPESGFSALVESDIISAVFDVHQAKKLSEEAIRQGRTVRVHIKIDSGMHRLGFGCDDASAEEIKQIANLPGVSIEGIFTHFAKADESDKTFTETQVRRFTYIVDALKAAQIEIPIVHAANSAAIIDCPSYHFDMVRAGIILYGLHPSDAVHKERIDLKPAMTLKAAVAQTHTIEAGEGVSYGLRFKAEKTTKVATIPIGYADGFSRRLSGKAMGLFGKVLTPILGTICMDQCILSAEGLDLKIGDEITLMGGAGISIDQYAQWLKTINYEVVCMIRDRVPRIYIKDGRPVDPGL